KEHELYLLESTFSYFTSITHSIPDVTTGKCKFGIQLKKLKDVIHNYIYNDKTKVAWCKLLNNPFDDVHKQCQLKENFTLFYNQYHQRLYDMDPLSLLGSMFPAVRHFRDKKDILYNKLWNKFQN